MFNSTYIWVNEISYSAEKIKTEEHENIFITYLVDQKKADQLIKLYFDTSETDKFCIALQDLKKSVNVNSIINLLSHPCYARTNDSIVLFVFDNSQKDDTYLLKQFLFKQGYTKPTIITIKKSNENKGQVMLIKKESVTNIPDQEFATFYKTYLRSRYNFNDMVLINGNSKNMGEIRAELTAIKNRFLQEEPYLGRIIKQVYDFNKQNAYLNQVKTLQEAELATIHDLFTQNAEHKELEYVLNFYHKQYEVLPLWYKRFGHIIKLLTGKRSWRSFTNDKH